ncbi:MAG: hypothetical protein M3144_03580 [Actinomycetota bacterium]|nr:hypothetical protein [Actinomycetota bacterium]
MTDRDPGAGYPARPARDEVEPGVPATTEMPRHIPPGSEDEEIPPPLEFPQGVEDWGTTAREELVGEPFELRVKREEPDRPRRDDAGGASLYEPGADDGVDQQEGLDTEPDAVGELSADDDVTLSPEEAAVRIEEEPGGLTYDATPGYLDHTES